MKTQRGIYLDITESTYPFTVGEITFYFSSIFYRSKFMNDYQSEIKRFNESANNVYKNKFCIDMTPLALIRLYVLIEKRGFYLKIKGVEVTCLENLKMALEINAKEIYKI
jgi:hypothetical protein